ncbi:DUF3298 and DUF4163 domain-containing protein [Dysgonomonas sp. 520]|uniref:DUF3298 and DUF4163 domain-containing protein n=1 Tax=Dysgonomonas sp. 520 TaxID=2302931 RepID=UPI0013D7FFEA|nr:DUF3298 and DUF4163 domain-containing protein [Dysgonomonas sp. 520]NDW09630.1 DUF3298 domain-containing protein [Dysgonomonas sp. 520]
MKRILYFLFLATLITSCNNKNKQASNETSDSKLSFHIVEFDEESKLAGKPQSTLNASIPVAGGDSMVISNINSTIFQSVKWIIAEDSDSSANYDELFSGFIRSYEDFIKEYSDSPGGWEAIIKGAVEYDSPELVNIKLDSYTMTGGAHGNSNMTSLLFDPKTGNQLFLSDIVNDTLALTRIAEEKFRNKYNIPIGKPINSTGYMFNNDKFALPQNIFVTKEGLLLYYNPYEAAAYVEGPKEITLPYEEIKNYLVLKFE